MALYTIITDILIVLASALLLGEIFERLRLPSVIGEILGGMIVGSAILGLVEASDPLRAISSIALFFIIFHIGFEMKTQCLQGRLQAASLFSVTSFMLPLVLTTGAAFIFFPFGSTEVFIFALAIAVPSLSIVSVLIFQYDLLQTTTGQVILASVTISDILAFIFLAGIVRSLESTFVITVEIFIFIIGFIVVDALLNRRPEVIQKILSRLNKLFKRQDFAVALMIVFALLISAIFQDIGLSFILGAFFAGLIIHDDLIGKKTYDKISQTLSTMNSIFFIPLFFGFAGVEVVLAGITFINYVGLAVLITIALGTGVALTYYVSKKILHKVDVVPKQLAGILGGRGAIGIVIASVALSEGFLSQVGFSLVVLATLVISIIIPFLAGRRKEKDNETNSLMP